MNRDLLPKVKTCPFDQERAVRKIEMQATGAVVRYICPVHGEILPFRRWMTDEQYLRFTTS